MTKKTIISVVLLSIVCSWLFNLFFGRQLAAELSTLPVLNRWHILNPQAPIVITNRETVRVADNSVAVSASGVKSKLALVLWVNGGSVQVEGGALNLTSDGNFIAAASSFSQSPGNYFVELDDGRTAKIISQVSDPATSLVFFKADLNNVPVANFADSSSLNPGDRVAFVLNSLDNSDNKIALANVTSAESDIVGQVFESDYPRRGFGVAADQQLLPGQAISDSNGDVAGIWNGSAVISSDVLKQAANLYLNGNQTISRPSFGFSYQIISSAESSLSGQPQGALVKSVAKNSAARQAALQSNDIITAVDGQAIGISNPLESVLQGYKPGDTLALTVTRGKSVVNLKLTAGELK